MKKLTLIWILLFGLLLAACGGSSQPALEGTAWSLARLHGQAALSGSAPTLVFKDGQASGSGSCNSFGGSYEIRGERLTFGPLAMTAMACADSGLMEQESAYMTALAAASKFRLENDQLILYDASGQALAEFVKGK
ncbi:MAG: META domain-containing protein [Chloroflexi bacterium]|nr:META domain-containing protein [Chloroflexota bacterium]